MGIADPIPGVSAGTMAFVLGIYYRLLAAISAINILFFKDIFCLRGKKALQRIDWLLLLPLCVGILLALITTANLIHFLLKNYHTYLWSFFFGLIVISTLLLMKNIPRKIHYVLFFLSGALCGYLISSINPIEVSISYWFLILCGFIAISSLLLPGISGAFVLVILGQYDLIISAIKNPFTTANIVILSYFYIGALVGLLTTAHLLSWVIKKWESIVLAFLTGLTLGSLKKIWPWKVELATDVAQDFNKNTIYIIIFLLFGSICAVIINKLPQMMLQKK